MKRIKDFLKKAWEFAEGNKTIFLSIVWGAIEAGLIPITGGWLTLVRIIIGAMGGYTLKKHYDAGFFSTGKVKKVK